MRFSPHLLDEIRARLSVSHVVGRKVALKKKGREFSGLSPFKMEKTPSFFVNDQKGFYHCFASGEHGDIFTFVMKTEGLSFPEAVERLAAEAGVQLPKPEARDDEREDERVRLYRLLEAAAVFFEESLRSGVGTDARRYIEKRGLNRDTLREFRLGFAPNSKSALKEHLAKAGFSVPDMIAAGMAIAGDDIPLPYDRFRNRVMFPITDLKGRVIAFGGRALDPDAPAKYLNSPETPLFHKGHVLFNAARARPLVHDRNRIIVVEGYMDVVALTEGGFGEAVAPLGTALTEDQVKLLWRMTAEPILCFDGDSAGKKAAYRAIETALPHLKPGYSVRFAFLPDGLDPDDLIRQQGPAAFDAVLGKTQSLIDVLWARERDAQPATTPEQRAAFEARLKALAARIADTAVRHQYENELRETLWAWNRSMLRQVMPFPGGGGQRPGPKPAAGRRVAEPDWRQRERLSRFGRPPVKAATVPAAASQALINRPVLIPQREALLLKTMINHPRLLDQQAEEIAQLALTPGAAQKLRDGLLEIQAQMAGEDNSLDRTTLRTQLSKNGLDRAVDLVERSITHRSDRFAEPDADDAEVDAGWRHALSLHERQAGLLRSLEAAERAWLNEGSQEAFARILEVQRQMASEHRVEAFDGEGEGSHST